MRILLIEDQEELVQQLAAVLGEMGFSVSTALDGSRGYDLAVSEPFDAIVLDLMLPGLDGRDFLEALRDHDDVPVLILSALDGVDTRIQCLDAGADDYLVKPFDVYELAARLRALVRRTGRASGSILQVGSLSVDLNARKVFRESVVVDLTAQEYRLLEALALAGGSPVSRETLGARIGSDLDEANRNNLVSVHMHNLRRKLGTEHFETRRGFGYALAGVDP